MKGSLLFTFSLLAVISLIRMLSADTPYLTNFQKPSVSDYTQFDANSISAYITNYGNVFRHPLTGNSGFEWPKGSGKTEIYESGLWVGAKVNGEARVAVAYYAYEYAPGSMDIGTHLPNNPEDPTFKVYKIEQGNTSSWDYRNWPYWDGAPLNGNGVPLMIGNQTLWCVYNDADSAVHINMGSKPLGVEVQQTIFGWNIDYLNLKDVVFIRYLVVNKSAEMLDSTYLTMWCDSDLGDSGDDMTGTDSLLQLGFVYNDSNIDGEFGEEPPAVGISLLQGPIASSPGDTAIFYGGKKPGYKNLPVNSIVCPLKPQVFNNGSPSTFQDVYNLMQARWKDGWHMTYGEMGNDTSSHPTNFMYTGNPVTGTGWLDPYPADKRFILNCGPVTLAPGDSQEVIFAVHIARGTSHLNSLTKLKQQSQNLHSIYPNKLFRMPKNLEYKISFPGNQQVELEFSLETKEATQISGELYTYGSAGVEDTLLQTFDFHDDGQHDDGEANDGRWGAKISSAAHRNGGYLNVKTTFPDGEIITMKKVKDRIPLAGKLEILQPAIGSDNLNNDGIVNPGENVRYTLKLSNHTHFDLSDVKITPYLGFNSGGTTSFGTSEDIGFAPMPVTLNQIPANTILNWEYAPQKPYLYFATYGLDYNEEIDVEFVISLEDGNYNYWDQPIQFHITPLAYQPEYNSTMNLIGGNVDGSFHYILVNPWELKGHTYQISFEKQEDKLLYELKDENANIVKLNSRPLPDQSGHNSALVDGFKILRGGLEYKAYIRALTINPQDRWLTSVFYFIPGGFYHYWAHSVVLGNHEDKWQGSIPFWEYPNEIKIEFDSTLTTFCKVYRIDQNYQVHLGLGKFYGAAYDMTDAFNPRRLNIVFMENDSLKPSDMIWNPDSTSRGGEELFFIMNSNYDAQTGGGYDNINFAPESDVLIKAALALREGWKLYESPLTLNIKLNRNRPGLDDVFEFTPVWQNPEELEYQLYQNYPNPFNNVTTIPYSIVRPQRVKLEVFNALGQRVTKLVDQLQQPRNYSIEWDARNFASGIYFYRLSAGEFQQTKKLLLIK